MATLRKRGCKWHVQIRRSGHIQTKSFSLKADAETWARLVERNIDTGEIKSGLAGSSSTKIGDLLKRYREEVLPNKKSAPVESYIIERFQQHTLGSVLTCEVVGADITKYRDQRLSLVKEGTVHRELSVLRHCFEVARKEWGIPLKTNPVSEITMPSPGKPRNRRVTKAELSALRLACSHPLLWQIITMAIETAMQSPRALKEPVGNRPSSLTITRPSPVLNPASSISGVMISPRLTMFSARRTGRNSR